MAFSQGSSLWIPWHCWSFPPQKWLWETGGRHIEELGIWLVVLGTYKLPFKKSNQPVRVAWLAPTHSSHPSWGARCSSPRRAPDWTQVPEGPQPMPHGTKNLPNEPSHPTESNVSLKRWNAFFSTQTHQKEKKIFELPGPGGGRRTSVLQESSYWLSSKRGEKADRRECR